MNIPAFIDPRRLGKLEQAKDAAFELSREAARRRNEAVTERERLRREVGLLEQASLGISKHLHLHREDRHLSRGDREEAAERAKDAKRLLAAADERVEEATYHQETAWEQAQAAGQLFSACDEFVNGARTLLRRTQIGEGAPASRSTATTGTGDAVEATSDVSSDGSTAGLDEVEAFAPAEQIGRRMPRR